jgi:hypothetical protein
MMAELVIRERYQYPDGDLAELVVWRVPEPVPPTTHGFKYRFAYISGGRRVLGYDNERGRGDHRHVGETEEAFAFSSVDELLARFVAEIEDYRRCR